MSVGDPNAAREPLAALALAVAEAPDDAVWQALNAAARPIGYDLLTVMRVHPDAWEVERLHSTDAAAYPVGGRKQKRATAWGASVLEAGHPYRGSGEDAIRWAFDDARTILDLGLLQVINMPVRIAGRTVGTVNLLRRIPAYDAADETALRLLATLIASRIA